MVTPKIAADGMRILLAVAITAVNTAWVVQAVALVALIRRFH